MTFQVCLTATGKRRKIIEVQPDDTLKDLYQITTKAFGQKCMDLKNGFPPKSLESSDIKVQTILPNNDRVTAILNEAKSIENGKTKKLSSHSNAKSSTSQSTGRRSQRSAAKAATDSFAEVIKAQDKLMKEQEKPSRKRPRVSPSKRTSSDPSTSRKLAKLPGRRLGDGAKIGPSNSQKVRKAGSSAKFREKDDVSFALFNALENSGGGKVGQVLRGAMRNAVSRQYDASRAMTRVSAVQAGKYNICEVETESNKESSTTTGRLRIKFDKMMEGRGEIEELVDFIPRDALEAVIKAIHGSDPESLRAATLSQLSPRVFWSILKETTNSPNCIETALPELLPCLDWGFLSSRKKTLSEKAKENLRQEQFKNGIKEQNLDQAAEAVQAVEQAMDQLHSFDQTQRRNRAAHAALERQSSEFDWNLITPADTDEQELMDCADGDVQMVQKLIVLGIRNWRELANIEDAKKLATQLEIVDTSIVETWIDRAQIESVEEIIVELCDSCVEAVEALRVEARTGTPKDLANWRSMPEILLESAPSLKRLERKISEKTISTWCIRAHALLAQYEWLNWYATPVD